MIRNLPGQPTLVTITILAHHGALYRISVPGATPARDQLTALRSCREMWMPDDTIVPMMRGIKGAAVLSLRTKTYKLIPLPSGPAEFSAFKGALTLTKWIHGSWPGNYDHRPVTPKGTFEPKRGGGAKKSTTPTADTDTKKVA